MNLTFLGWSKMKIKSFGQIILLCSAVMTLAACQSLDTARLKKFRKHQVHKRIQNFIARV